MRCLQITDISYRKRVCGEYFVLCITLVFMSTCGRPCLYKSISVVFTLDYLNFGHDASKQAIFRGCKTNVKFSPRSLLL